LDYLREARFFAALRMTTMTVVTAGAGRLNPLRIRGNVQYCGVNLIYQGTWTNRL
jgi:hypothetical protein